MLIDKNKIKDKNYLSIIKKKVLLIENDDNFQDAFRMSKELDAIIREDADFRKSFFELYQEYQEIIIKLRWVGMQIMTETQVEEMFKNHFAKIFSIPGFNIWNKLKIILLANPVYEERDNFKKNITRALLSNREKLTSKNLSINKQEQAPTVGNWISEYNFTLGTGRVDEVKRTQYLINSENVKKLNENEKQKLKILFNLYEKLKLSSLTLEGLEEEIPVKDEDNEGVIKNSIFIPHKETPEQKRIWEIIKGEENQKEKSEMDLSGFRKPLSTPQTQEETEIKNLEEMAAQYELGSLERRAIEEEIRKMKLSIRYQGVKK